MLEADADNLYNKPIYIMDYEDVLVCFLLNDAGLRTSDFNKRSVTR